ncbi:hypothetical protein GCM10011289_05750 [Paludibacterium paludis]|uniref:Uncharacterized protein n=1 Tax=Paludibacterium paludis TaxID=1225769 RepID=A0A918U7U4_9NEIS|nr:hypothetical protein GCM10011289_05750 [Paludibacterium paludis]
MCANGALENRARPRLGVLATVSGRFGPTGEGPPPPDEAGGVAEMGGMGILILPGAMSEW